MRIETPIFLVGSERSGTSLLRLMLDHHPRIALQFESDYIVTQVSDDGVFPEIGRYRAWLADDRAFQFAGFGLDEKFDYVGLVNHFLAQKQVRDKKDMVGATVHHQFSKLSWIWPQAKYIYLLRDGRDVATSVMRMGWAGNVYVAADVWLEAERQRDIARARVAEGHWLEVRYEELILSTRSQLERICAFLGATYSEEMLGYVKTSTYQAPDASLCYQWKKNLRAADVQNLEEKLGDRLTMRGYELSGHARIRIPPLTKKRYYLQSRIGRYLFRLRRYGISLTLQETLSRRLGLERVHRRVMNRINRITNTYMK